jgi:hypothetical protein
MRSPEDVKLFNEQHKLFPVKKDSAGCYICFLEIFLMLINLFLHTDIA